MIALIASIAFAGLVGAIFVTLGLHGRRLDDHPVCRRCHFDLVGIYPNRMRCPECGGGLSAPAVRVGRRRRQWWTVTSGLVLLLFAAAAAAGVGWAWKAGFDWNTVKPAWWLLRDARSDDDAISTAAAAELCGRSDRGNLSDASLQAAVEIVLARRDGPLHSPASRMRLNPWDGLFQQARAQGRVSDQQFRSYLRQAIRPSIVWHRVHPGGRLWLYLSADSDAAGVAESLRAYFAITGCLIDGRPMPILADAREHPFYLRLGKGSRSWRSDWRATDQIRVDQMVVDALPGEHRLSLQTEFRFYAGKGDEQSLLTTIQETFEGPIEVVPDHEPLARLVLDPPLAQEPQFLGVFAGEVDLGGPFIAVCAAVRWPRQPEVYLNYDLIAREGTQEWVIGQATRYPTGGGSEGSNGLMGFAARVVDVVLRPDPVDAGERLDVESIWGREYVFRDVQVQWVDDPHAAAEALVKGLP